MAKTQVSSALADAIGSGPSTETAGPTEWPPALYALRARYRVSRDLFSPRETAHLRFLRWLVHTGRLVPDGQFSEQQPRAEHNSSPC